MAEKDITCIVASDRLDLPYESLSLSFKDETNGSFKFPIENEGDLSSMVEHCHNRGLKEVHMQAFKEKEDSSKVHSAVQVRDDIATSSMNLKSIEGGQPLSTPICVSDRIPNDNPSGDNVPMIDDMISRSERIPAWWHTALTGEGQRFESAKELRLALLYYSMAKKFEYLFAKNEPKRIRVFCRFKEAQNYPWMLFASPTQNENRLEIKTFVDNHTCGNFGNNAGQSRASRQFIATQVLPTLKVRPDLRPIDVQKELLTSYGLRVDYSKILWGKERAQEQLYGDAHESYDQLRWYVEEVKKTNPGSYIHVEQNEGRFSKLFICYAACINGFLNGCIPLIFLDGTFLKDRFKGILLSAIAYDGNQGIFPLAYCICDQENTVNWNWFLQGLWSILYERPDPYNSPHKLVIISDADKGIREAVREYFPDAIHSRCALHLVENFRKKLRDLGFKAKDTRILGNLLQSACYKYTKAEWNDYVEDIRLADERAYNIVMNYAPENWANAFSPGIRYGHVTSNVAESFNKWIHEARLLRILQLVEHIRKQIMVCMNERRLMAESWNGFLCPKAEVVLKENMENGRPLDVRQSHTRLFERDVYQFCDWFMTVEAFKKSYEPILYPIPDYEKRSVPREEIQILPPLTTKRKGRNKTRRINNRTVYTRPLKCSRCHVEGHNRKTCNESIAD
ncbi:uncharacterized protein LOC109847650 [Asparagus officinalis]|uniref:uncharacterized protein LOC109847650 n=1 Tax=Asparagus officinalis TaxID=4686 RepID=UPI00098E66B1|nr:uncharacterized protein LOC109847650 [Asparagus officinalis]